jgi:hypothetical protein
MIRSNCIGVLACLLGIGAAPVLAADITAGLVLHYSFDAPPKSGKVLDESGRGNNGTVTGPVYVQDGGSAGAYRFDGVDDYIRIPATTSLNVGSGNAYTLAIWYNTTTDSEANRQSPLLEWGGTTVAQDGVHLWANTYGYQWNGLGTGANLVDTTGNEVLYVISAAAAKVLNGVNTVLKDPASAVWRVAVDAQDVPVNRPHEWINYAPQMLDLPATGVGNAAVGTWINQTLVNAQTGAVVWDDATEADRLSPGYSFQASLAWIDLGQTAYRDRAVGWANASGLHQVTGDLNGIAGGWIDWVETGGGQAQWWERFIDTSFYNIAVSEGGYNFSAE